MAARGPQNGRRRLERGPTLSNSILGLPLDIVVQVDGLLGEDGRLVDLAEKLLMSVTVAVISGPILYFSSYFIY